MGKPSMLLQSRPDLTLIAIVGLIAVVLFLVKMAEDIHRGAASPDSGSRRSFIESIVALFVSIFLLAFTLPTAITTLEEDDSNEIDDFEDQNLSEWDHTDGTDWTTVTDDTAYSGDTYASSAG